jgi:hypothetical protein
MFAFSINYCFTDKVNDVPTMSQKSERAERASKRAEAKNDGKSDTAEIASDDPESDPTDLAEEYGEEIGRAEDLDEARELAVGCRPKHEFYQERTRLKNKCKVFHYGCCQSECECSRFITKAKSGFLVFEKGKHIENHPPSERTWYPLSRAQIAFMKEKVMETPKICTSELRREMRAAKLHRLCPNETIRGWIKRRRLKGSFRQNDYQPLITELVSLIRRLSDFHRRVLFDPVDDYQTIWLPVDNNEYIQFGEHVEGSAATIQGRKVSFTIPISNHYYLGQIKSTCEVTTRTLDLESLKDLATTGPRLKEIENLGFLMMDGVHALISGKAVVLQVGTVINGIWRPLGFSVCSGETGYHGKKTVEAFQTASLIVHGPDYHLNWQKSDAGTGICKALKRSAGKDNAASACSAHLIMDSLPKKRGLFAEKKHRSWFKADVVRMKKFPPFLARRFFQGMVQKYEALGEGRIIKYFRDHHVDKNLGWTSYRFAHGYPSHINHNESANFRGLEKPVLRAARQERKEARLPIPLTTCIRLLTEKVMPQMALDEAATAAEFAGRFFAAPSARDRKLAGLLAMHPNLVDIGNGVHVSRQFSKDGDLARITAKQAREHANLFLKKEWSPLDIKLVGSIRFTTTEFCWPCDVQGEKLFCVCQLAVRIREGAGPLPGEVMEADRLAKRSAKRGRPRNVSKVPKWVKDFGIRAAGATRAKKGKVPFGAVDDTVSDPEDFEGVEPTLREVLDAGRYEDLVKRVYEAVLHQFEGEIIFGHLS